MKKVTSFQETIEVSIILHRCVEHLPEATTICLSFTNSEPQADVLLPLGLVLGAGSLPSSSQDDQDLFRHALSRRLLTKVTEPQARALLWLGERVPDLVTIDLRQLDAYICPNGTVKVVPRPGSEDLPVFANNGLWHSSSPHPKRKCHLLAEAIRGPQHHSG
jgi:hypothetical protein